MNSGETTYLKNLWRNEKPLFAWITWATFFYSILCILRHWHFGSNVLDLGNFDQMVWHYSRFEPPACSQLHLQNSLGDHFSPVLALLAPLFWVFPRAEALLVAQAALVSLAMIPIFLFVEKRLGRRCAYLFVFSFTIFWGTQDVINYDFHPDVIAIPIIAFAILFTETENWIGFFISMVLLLLTKEDLTLLVAFFGVYGILRGKWKLGASVILLGLAAFILEVMVLVPYFRGPGEDYNHWSYSDFGKQPMDSLVAVLKNPLLVFKVLFSNWEKVWTLTQLFLPYLFLPFFSRLTLLTVPLIAAKLLSSWPALWGLGFHYTAALCPILAMAAADGLYYLAGHSRFELFRLKRSLYPSSAVLAINLIAILFLSPWRYIEHGWFWKLNSTEKTAFQVFAMIPPEASVTTQSAVAPHLTHRKNIYVLGLGGECSVKSDFFVACRSLNQWPISWAEVEACREEKEKEGYQKIFDQNGWIVLKAASQQPKSKDAPG